MLHIHMENKKGAEDVKAYATTPENNILGIVKVSYYSLIMTINHKFPDDIKQNMI